MRAAGAKRSSGAMRWGSADFATYVRAVLGGTGRYRRLLRSVRCVRSAVKAAVTFGTAWPLLWRDAGSRFKNQKELVAIMDATFRAPVKAAQVWSARLAAVRQQSKRVQCAIWAVLTPTHGPSSLHAQLAQRRSMSGSSSSECALNPVIQTGTFRHRQRPPSAPLCSRPPLSARCTVLQHVVLRCIVSQHAVLRCTRRRTAAH